MWRNIVQGEWPYWAIGLTSLWRHKSGHWLSSRTIRKSALWELRTPEGEVYINQHDLPFQETTCSRVKKS
jgi:hypothetical protein